MREHIKILLLAIPTLSAWDRVEILDAIEKIYQIKRHKIIWTTVGVVSFIYAILFYILSLIMRK